jgi:hypothetical protein
MGKWTTIEDIPTERTWKGRTYQYVLVDSGMREWEAVRERWPRLAREFDGAFLVTRDGHEVRAAYFFDGRIPYLHKGVYCARVQKRGFNGDR